MKRIFVCSLVIIGLIGTAEARRTRSTGYHQKNSNYEHYGRFNSKQTAIGNPKRNPYLNPRINPLKPLAKPNYAEGLTKRKRAIQW